MPLPKEREDFLRNRAGDILDEANEMRSNEKAKAHRRIAFALLEACEDGVENQVSRLHTPQLPRQLG